jgi:hypothetical protein
MKMRLGQLPCSGLRQPLGIWRWKILLADLGVTIDYWTLQRVTMASMFFGMLLSPPTATI